MSETNPQTWVEWAKAHYTAEGEARGAARSEVRGALRADRWALRMFLEKRFGPLPAALIERIETCEDLDRLETNLLQVLDIHSPDELQL